MKEQGQKRQEGQKGHKFKSFCLSCRFSLFCPSYFSLRLCAFAWNFVFFSCINETLLADPWGKDADLVHVKQISSSSSTPCTTPVFGTLGELLISFHQNVISPADGPRSHFIPSSSQYTLDAMRKYGFFEGFMMGCDRLMRENPEEWVYRKTLDSNGKLMKYDPVK